MLHSFLLGAFITFFYDLFRVLRRIIPHGIFLISLEDMAFWILATGGIFYLLYYENNGMFRWFAITGAGAGMLLYKKTLSGPFVRLTSEAVNRTLRFLGGILWKLTAPFRFVWRRSRKLAERAARRTAVEIRVRRRRVNSRLTAWKKETKIKVTGWKKRKSGKKGSQSPGRPDKTRERPVSREPGRRLNCEKRHSLLFQKRCDQ